MKSGRFYSFCEVSKIGLKIIYKHSIPISGKINTEDIRSYLENILSEFNHLVSVLLKGDKVVETTQTLINQKIVGHA